MAKKKIKEFDGDKADLVARMIFSDCLDRRGIKRELEQVDDLARKEILDDWAGIVRHVFRKEAR